MNNKFFRFLSILTLLSGCNEYEKIMGPALKAKMQDTNSVFDGFEEPPMPDPKENDKTLFGIDSNNNGIRDDIDIWINRTGKTYNERMALRQLALAYKEEWIVGNLAYETYLKGPIDIFDPVQRENQHRISKRVQETATQQADASMGCMQFVFVEPKYLFSDKQRIEKNLFSLYNNSPLREKSIEAYYNYYHSYVTTPLKEKSNYCTFQIENLEQAKSNYDESIIIREKRTNN